MTWFTLSIVIGALLSVVLHEAAAICRYANKVLFLHLLYCKKQFLGVNETCRF
jgi:hypothetical protein